MGLTHSNTVPGTTGLPPSPCLKGAARPLPTIVTCLLLALCGCAGRNVVFATNTVLGVDVSGTISQQPDHVSIAYDRQEVVYVPKRKIGQAQPISAPSTSGRLDAEVSFWEGVAVAELFATGRAAEQLATARMADPSRAAATTQVPPMLVLTRSKVGLIVDMPKEELLSPSMTFGYKRQNLAAVPVQGDLVPAVYADISVHSKGFLGINGMTPSGIPAERRISSGAGADGGGMRIVQTIATGAAAESVAGSNREVILKRIFDGSEPLVASAWVKKIGLLYQDMDGDRKSRSAKLLEAVKPEAASGPNFMENLLSLNTPELAGLYQMMTSLP